MGRYCAIQAVVVTLHVRAIAFLLDVGPEHVRDASRTCPDVIFIDKLDSGPALDSVNAAARRLLEKIC